MKDILHKILDYSKIRLLNNEHELKDNPNIFMSERFNFSYKKDLNTEIDK